MTGFALLAAIDYEGSSILGFFEDIEKIYKFLQDSSYAEDVVAFNKGIEPELVVDPHFEKRSNIPANATTCWTIEGENDVTFVIYSFVI